MVVSLSTIGTKISAPVFVEFQTLLSWFPPVEIVLPVLKSDGGVLSKTTQLELVVLVTSTPSFPAESEKVKLKTTSPSVSVSKNWYPEWNSALFISVMVLGWPWMVVDLLRIGSEALELIVTSSPTLAHCVFSLFDVMVTSFNEGSVLS